MDPTLVMLYILDNEDEKPRCARMRCEGVATFAEFRALLEKKPSRILWPFDFYDAEMKCRIATEFEQITHLESYDHKVTVIRSDDTQAMEKKRKRVDEESMALLEPTTVKEVIPPASTITHLESYDHKVTVIRSDDTQAMEKKRKRVDEESMALLEPTTVKEVIPPASTVYIAPVACDLMSDAPFAELNEPEETSCPELDPKHKVFLSHSGVEKPFVGKLCKLLEEHNHYPFFDERPDSLPKGKKFAGLIIEAAKTCRVAVVVLSEDYLSSKWPMIELAEFVSAIKSSNKDLNLLPLFYKVSPRDLDDMSIKDKWMPKWIELARADGRVDPEKWAEAVRELRRANGIEFCKFEKKKESYCDAIVKAIFKLAPPDLLYDMSGIHGGDRICKIMADKFQRHPKTSASVLGLYGMGGSGKTIISKCLCNYFIQEFLGRVCYIEMEDRVNALVRQQEVMRKLLRFVEPMMQNICDASQGWDILKRRMKEYPVLLIIDNIQPGEEEEALKYLNLEYNSLSKIMVVSRGLDVVGKLLGDGSYCCEIPPLEREEAVGILLQQRGQSLEVHLLSKEERGIVEGFVEQACFGDDDVTQTISLHGNGGSQYHPLAVRVLGACLERRCDAVFKVLDMQFSLMGKMKQLMYLDIVLYARFALDIPKLSNSPLEDMEIWLANIHDVGLAMVKQKIAYFKKLGMLHIEREEIVIHDLYKEYAQWAVKHVVISGGLVGVWAGEFNHSFKYLRIPEELQRSPYGSCWQELRRFCLVHRSFHGFAERRFQDWHKVVVLQLIDCDDVTTLNLQGLTCIRHLELQYLGNLQTLVLTEDESSSHDTEFQASCVERKLCSPRPWLQYVVLSGLSLLEHLPSFSPFTFLKYLEVVDCEELREPPRVQHCVHLRRMQLEWFHLQRTFPILDGLASLQDLTIRGNYVQGGFKGLKLEGLSSLISLGSLELGGIPVGDLNGLEKLPNVEYIRIRGMYSLEYLPPLEGLARSSLLFLDLWVSDEQKNMLEKLQRLISEKLERSTRRGEHVPHFPNKIEPW